MRSKTTDSTSIRKARLFMAVALSVVLSACAEGSMSGPETESTDSIPPADHPAPTPEMEPQSAKMPSPAAESPAPAAPQREEIGLPMITAHVASFQTKSRADMAAKSLGAGYPVENHPIYVYPVHLAKKGHWYRVSLGGFDSKEAAAAFCRQVQSKKRGCEVISTKAVALPKPSEVERIGTLTQQPTTAPRS
jgi:hypothetical protein